MDIYTQLRAFLQAEYDKGATDQAIASRLGCSQAQVNNLRNGKRSFAKMHLETLLRLFPHLSIALGGVPLHGSPTAAVNGHGNIVTAGDASGNHIFLQPDACAGEIESFRSGLIMEIIELEIEAVAKDLVLRTARNYRRKDLKT